jgi:HAD superfamily hydrolase (TIGR01509 family)
MTGNGPIEAVLFDGDQTLWDFQLVMHTALVAVLGELRAARPGPATDQLGIGHLQADRNAVAGELQGVEFNLRRLRLLGFARTLNRLRPEGAPASAADAALVEQLTSSYFHTRDLEPALFPDTLPALKALRPLYRLGLLSNGSRQPGTIGLDGYFETIVFAQDHRVAKPDRGIFAVAERALGLSPARCVLVGDSPVNDVVGAKRSGWRAIWIDRVGNGTFPVPEGCAERPDAIVTSLDSLPAVLSAMVA